MRTESTETQARVSIPSSDRAPDRDAGGLRPRPRTGAKAFVTVLAVSVVGIVLGTTLTVREEPETVVPAPFETIATESSLARPPVAWSSQGLPGAGSVLAVGSAAGRSTAVTTDAGRALIWESTDGLWRLVGSPELGRVDSAQVTDDRILLVGRLSGRPTVWEWVDGESRYLFQSTSGPVSGTWSVAGRLAVAVSESGDRVDTGFPRGGSDVLWVESAPGEFERTDLGELATVETVTGDADTLVVGGSDTDSLAAIAFVQEARTIVDRLPTAGGRSAVTDIETDAFSVVALVSIPSRAQPTRSEIWISDRTWDLLGETDGLADMVIVDRVVHAVTVDGDVVSVPMDGGAPQAPSVPDWPGWVEGVTVLDGRPVMFGSSAGRPTFSGPNAGASTVALPEGRWSRYHSETTVGHRLVHVGSPEFSVRGGRLFHRAWNGERWRLALGDLAVYGDPTIVETTHGFVLVPAARGGLWASVDGESWNRLEDTEQSTIEQVATDGDVVVGVTRVGDPDGPASEVTTVDGSGRISRVSLPVGLVGLGWEDGVGFFATVSPPGLFGHVTSQDGAVWTFVAGGAPFEQVVGLDGALHLSSGERVDGGPSAEMPTDSGGLFVYDGGVRTWQADSGATWIHDGVVWHEVGLGVLDGLPARPERLTLLGSRLFATTVGVDGGQEIFVTDLG